MSDRQPKGSPGDGGINGPSGKSRERHPVTFEIVQVTPELAAEWLSTMRGNRTLVKRTAALYGQFMARDEWYDLGEAVSFDWNGRLLNGQHRLHGVVISGKTVTLRIVRGLDPRLKWMMDNNLPRSKANVMQIAGVSHAGPTASAAGVLMRIDRAHPRPFRNDGNAANMFDGRQLLAVVPHPLIDEDESDPNWEVRYPDLPYAVEEAARVSKQGILGGTSLWAALFLWMRREDEDAAGYFIEGLRTGSNMDADDPVHVLRETIIKDRGKPRNKQALETYAALGIKAWFAHLEGRTVKRLKWDQTKEAFPRMKLWPTEPEV